MSSPQLPLFSSESWREQGGEEPSSETHWVWTTLAVRIVTVTESARSTKIFRPRSTAPLSIRVPPINAASASPGISFRGNSFCLGATCCLLLTGIGCLIGLARAHRSKQKRNGWGAEIRIEILFLRRLKTADSSGSRNPL